jgi:hypothetical protein
MKKEIPIFELFIENIDIEGVTAISFVEFPAIKTDFKYFNDTIVNKYTMSKTIDEKMIVVGPAIVPNKPFIRQNEYGELYYVKFTDQLVADLAHGYLKESKQHNTTEQHNSPAKNIFMIESWIVEDTNDKIYSKYNFTTNEVPIGSWCVMYKVDNLDIWNKIKNGQIKGFSIEAYLSEKLIKNSNLKKHE